MRQNNYIVQPEKIKENIRNRTENTARYMADLRKRVNNLKNDPQKKVREAERQCRFCFYAGNRFGGAAMTEWNCIYCNVISLAGNTNTPVVCNGCSDKFKICTRCSGKLSGKINEN